MLQLKELNSNSKPFWLVNDRYNCGEGPSCALKVVGADLIATIGVRGALVEIEPIAKNLVKVNGSQVSQPTELQQGDQFQLAEKKYELCRSDSKMASAALSESYYDLCSVDEPADRTSLYQLTIIGRGDECDKVIAHARISRRHAELKVIDKKLYLRDLGSANGTFVNTSRVQSAELNYGDEISIAEQRYVIARPGSFLSDVEKTTLRPQLSLTEVSPVHQANPLNTQDPVQEQKERREYHHEQLRRRALQSNKYTKPDSLEPVSGFQWLKTVFLFLILGGLGYLAYWYFVIQ